MEKKNRERSRADERKLPLLFLFFFCHVPRALSIGQSPTEPFDAVPTTGGSLAPLLYHYAMVYRAIRTATR